MKKFITDIFEEINGDVSKLADYKDHTGLKIIFKHAFTPEGKFLLPEGEAPFTPAPEPFGMTPTNFQQELRRLYIFTREDLKAVRRETLFVELLEGIHPTEAKILLAIKDQNIPSVWKNITRKNIIAAGFTDIPETEPTATKKPKASPAAAEVSETKKSETSPVEEVKVRRKPGPKPKPKPPESLEPKVRRKPGPKPKNPPPPAT